MYLKLSLLNINNILVLINKSKKIQFSYIFTNVLHIKQEQQEVLYKSSIILNLPPYHISVCPKAALMVKHLSSMSFIFLIKQHQHQINMTFWLDSFGVDCEPWTWISINLCHCHFCFQEFKFVFGYFANQ